MEYLKTINIHCIKGKNLFTFIHCVLMENKTLEWQPSEEDAFQISVKDWIYYYAIQADLDGLGRHYYKENKKSHEIVEVDEGEIIDWVMNKPDQIYKKCPCVVIMPNGHLQPLVERK